MADDDRQKLVDACDELLDFYCARGKSHGPVARRIRAERQSLTAGEAEHFDDNPSADKPAYDSTSSSTASRLSTMT